MNLEHDISRASTLARLDQIIDELRMGGKLDGWSSDDREWFAALLHPFGSTGIQCRRLSSAERTGGTASLLLSSIVDLAASGLSTEDLLAIVRLYAAFQSAEPTFNADDGQRVLRLAESMRRYLIDEPAQHFGFPDSRDVA